MTGDKPAVLPKPQHAPATWEKIMAVGMAFSIFSLVGWVIIRNQPFADQNFVVFLRIALSVAAAILGATIPGFLFVDWKRSGLAVRAGGALALCVLTIVFTPSVIKTGPAHRIEPAHQLQPPFSQTVEMREGDTEVIHGVTVKVGSIGFNPDLGGYFAKVTAYDSYGENGCATKGCEFSITRTGCNEFRVHIKDIQITTTDPRLTLDDLDKMGIAAEAFMRRKVTLIIEGRCQ